ncbi:MAG: hypothetical protein ACODAB_03350 [Gemmatimonadota bacterium]
MTDGTVADGPSSGSGVRTLPLAIAVVLGIAGTRLLMLGTQSAVSGGVLLLVGAMGAAGVALGSAGYGPSVEAAPDLSTRLGLGVLGGVLAGLLHGVLTIVIGWLGIPVLLSAGIDVELSAMEWWSRAAVGGLLGFTLGAVYYLLPGRSFLGRGTTFGLLLAAWQLFVVYPFRLGLGIAGLEAGWGVAPLVVLGAVTCGVVAAWAVAWGGKARDEPLSAPLVP